MMNVNRATRMLRLVGKRATRMAATSKMFQPFPANANSVSAFSTAHYSPDDEKPFEISGQPKILDNGSAIQVKFDEQNVYQEEPQSIYHASWLWYSDPTYIHSSSGQRLRRLGQFPGWKIIQAEKIDLETALTEEKSSCIFPNPAPPPGCLHSIGTVYKNKNTDPINEHEEDVDLLKVTWDTTGSSAHKFSHHFLTMCFSLQFL